MLLDGGNYATTGRRYDTTPSNVKIIFFREMEKILSLTDWKPWLLSNQSEFKQLKLYQFQDNEQFILERMEYCGW